jgi:hypothetical protein
VGESALYAVEQTDANANWTGLALGQGVIPPAGDGISAEDALSCKGLKTSFIFAPQAPDLSSAEKVDGFIAAVQKQLERKKLSRAIMWTARSGKIEDTLYALDIFDDGSQVSAAMSFPLCSALSAQIIGGSSIAVNAAGDGLTIEASTGQAVRFVGSSMRLSGGKIVDLPFTGETGGVLSYSISILRHDLYSGFNAGFQFLFANLDSNTKSSRPYIAQWFPLASGMPLSSNDQYCFRVSLCPLRSNKSFPKAIDASFDFAKSDRALVSWYRTPVGKTINLLPVSYEDKMDSEQEAGFVIHEGTVEESSVAGRNSFLFSPKGDFVLQIPDAKDGEVFEIMCGLNAAETLSFQPKTENYAGDRLHFVPGENAYIPTFPLPDASPVAEPFSSEEGLLTSFFLTSYCTLLRAPGESGDIHYTAQPLGARLFGKEGNLSNTPGLLWPARPGQRLPQSSPAWGFPMIPMAGTLPGQEGHPEAMTADQIKLLEETVIAPSRKAAIEKVSDMTMSASPQHSLGLLCEPEGGDVFRADADIVNVTTPSGVIASIDRTSGVWKRIQLGKNVRKDQECNFAFVNPTDKLQHAFNTNQLCLVVANASSLDDFKTKSSGSSTSEFLNEILIDGWGLAANIGQNNRYENYDNVMIIKSCRGKLSDLARSPDKWTMNVDFAAPKTVSSNSRDVGQLVILSQWIQDYFEKGKDKNPDFYGNFNQIIENENWSGILVLKASVSKLPHDLAGLAAGLNPENFYAHHFAIAFSRIDSESVDQMDSSSMFGLIDYTDTHYEDGSGESPVAPEKGVYDFKVLKLQALFENTAVKRFYSLVQLSLNCLFGDQVTGMGSGGNEYNALMLHGGYQSNGKAPVYKLTGIGTNDFRIDSDILLKVRIADAQMVTLEAGASSESVSSLIVMSGQMFFSIPAYTDDNNQPVPLDIFSFGYPGGTVEDDKGLAFGGLGVKIVIPPQGSVNQYSFETGSITFSPTAEGMRKESLYPQFALVLEGLVAGGSEAPPGETGYLPVITDCNFSSLKGASWYGLRCRLNMGTPGALAGKAGFNSTLLLAWGVGSGKGKSNKAFIGLALPGTGDSGKLFSIQNILKLSFGSLRLVKDTKKKSFILIMSQIALKFLGIKNLPPNGSVAFYLFGDPFGKANAQGLGWYTAYNKEKEG